MIYGGHVGTGLRIGAMSSITRLRERELYCKDPWACGESFSGVSGDRKHVRMLARLRGFSAHPGSAKHGVSRRYSAHPGGMMYIELVFLKKSPRWPTATVALRKPPDSSLHPEQTREPGGSAERGG